MPTARPLSAKAAKRISYRVALCGAGPAGLSALRALEQRWQLRASRNGRLHVREPRHIHHLETDEYVLKDCDADTWTCADLLMPVCVWEYPTYCDGQVCASVCLNALMSRVWLCS